MTVFCTDHMSNNIQYGVTLHYPSTSGCATAKRFGIPSISQWRGVQRWIRNCVKGADIQIVWGTSVPQYGLGKSLVGGLRNEVPQKLKQNVKLEYNF